MLVVALAMREKSMEKLVDPDDRSAGWLLRAIIAKLLDEGEDLYTLYQTDRIMQIWFTVVREDTIEAKDWSQLGIRRFTLSSRKWHMTTKSAQ